MLTLLVSMLAVAIAVIIASKSGFASAWSLFVLVVVAGVYLRAAYLMWMPGSFLAPWVLGDELNVRLGEALVHLSGALFVCSIAYLIHRPGWVGPHTRRWRLPVGGPKLEARLAAVSLVCLAAFVGVLIAEFGSVGAALSQLFARVITTLEGAKAALTLLVYISVIAALSAVVSRRIRGASLARPAPAIGLLMAAAVLIATGGRASVIVYFLGVLYCLELSGAGTTRRDRFALIAVVAVASLMIVAIGFRLRVAAQDVESSGSGQIPLSEYAASLSAGVSIVDGYVLGNVLARADGHDFGKHYAAIPRRLVPRAVVSDKPDSLEVQIREKFWNDQLTGIPPSFFGESFVSFGLGGLAMASYMLGWLLARVDAWRRSLNRHPEQIVAYSVIVPLVAFTLVRSGLEQGLFRLFLLWVAVQIVRALQVNARSSRRLGRRIVR